MELAELCDTSTSYIGQIEIGNRFPSVKKIEELAAALQIKPYMLFADEQDLGKTVKQPSVKTNILSDTAQKELIKRLNTAIRRVVRQTGSM